MEWQPIETAPRDGTRILALSKGYTVEGDEWHTEAYNPPSHFIVQWDAGTESWECGDDWFEEEELWLWIPLPAPPTA